MNSTVVVYASIINNIILSRAPTSTWQCPECRRSTRRGKQTRSSNYKSDLVLCEALLSEMMEHQDAWPFLQPVERKKFPEYYKVVKKPMDFQTMKNKMRDNK